MRDTKWNECPYCGADWDGSNHSGDPIGQDETAEVQCDKCQKCFMVSASYSVDYNTWKADCLNEGEHKWEPMTGAPIEYFKNKERCADCDARRTKPTEVDLK